MLPLNSWTLIIHFHSVQNIIPHHDHLHMHQTGIISIVIMRPLPHIRSKEHLGVIRCKALQGRKKSLIWGDIRQYYTWLHISVALSPPFLIAFCIRLHFTVAFHPSLVIPQSSGKNNVFHCVCWFNLPPVALQSVSEREKVGKWSLQVRRRTIISSLRAGKDLVQLKIYLMPHLCCLLITLCSWIESKIA